MPEGYAGPRCGGYGLSRSFAPSVDDVARHHHWTASDGIETRRRKRELCPARTGSFWRTGALSCAYGFLSSGGIFACLRQENRHYTRKLVMSRPHMITAGVFVVLVTISASELLAQAPIRLTLDDAKTVAL